MQKNRVRGGRIWAGAPGARMEVRAQKVVWHAMLPPVVLAGLSEDDQRTGQISGFL